MKPFLPFALLAVALLAAAPVADPAKTDKDRLQGTWTVTGVEADGQPVKDGPLAEHLLPMKLTFKDDTLTNSLHPEDKGTFTLDAEKKPATFDLIVKGDNDQVKEKLQMLYELKSGAKKEDDVLRLCGAPKSGAERPTEFNSKGGQIVITLKREEKKAEK